MVNIIQNVCTIVIFIVHSVILEEYDRKYVKCLVCQRMVEEMTNEISSISPKLKYSQESYNLQSKKNKKEPVEMRRSEVFLTELLDRICSKMEDYARAYSKTTGNLELIPLVIKGNMNPDINAYNIIQDGDLESLKFYCQSIISEYDEEIIELFQSGIGDVKTKLCDSTEICMYEKDEL